MTKNDQENEKDETYKIMYVTFLLIFLFVLFFLFITVADEGTKEVTVD